MGTTSTPRYDTSHLLQFDRGLPVTGFSVKYVHQGTEHYRVDGRSYDVRAGHYLLVNRTNTCHVSIQSTTPVLGLCIGLGDALIQDAAQAHRLPELFCEAGGADHFTGPDFLENMYDAQCTVAGERLRRMASTLFSGPCAELGSDRIIALAEAIVHDHVPIVPALQRVRAVRSGTRKDIYRRVQLARTMMRSCYDRPLDMALVAREAAMSEYHFARAFRMVEGTSPHRYLTTVRVEAARRLLLDQRVSVSEAAYRTGFNDAATFSKVFKKVTGSSPSALLERSRRN